MSINQFFQYFQLFLEKVGFPQTLIIPPFGAEWHAFCSIVSHITQHRLSSHRATQRFVNTWRLDSQFNPTSPLHTMLLLSTFGLNGLGANENLQRQWRRGNPSMQGAFSAKKDAESPCINLQSRRSRNTFYVRKHKESGGVSGSDI